MVNKKPRTRNDKSGSMPAALSKEAIANLTGFFDVLIQMDLAQKVRNEQRSKEDGKPDNKGADGTV